MSRLVMGIVANGVLDAVAGGSLGFWTIMVASEQPFLQKAGSLGNVCFLDTKARSSLWVIME